MSSTHWGEKSVNTYWFLPLIQTESRPIILHNIMFISIPFLLARGNTLGKGDDHKDYLKFIMYLKEKIQTPFIVTSLNWITQKNNHSGVFLYYLMEYFSRKPSLCPWVAKLNYGNCAEWTPIYISKFWNPQEKKKFSLR